MVLISFIWLGVNIHAHGLSIKLYSTNFINLKICLYVFLFTLLATSIYLISVILPNSEKFKKLSELLGWLFIIGCFSVGFYLIYLSKS